MERVLPERRFELRWWIEVADIFRRCESWDNGESWRILQRFWGRPAEQPAISLEPTEAAGRSEAVMTAETAVDGLMQDLVFQCTVDSDPAIGFLLWHELAEILISIAGRNRDLSKFRHQVLYWISGHEVPLRPGEPGSPQWEKIAAQKRMLMPARFVRYLDMCVRGWPSNSPEFRDLCDAAVHEVIRITYEDICPGADRLEFIRSIQEIIASVRNTVLAAMSDAGCEIDPLTLSEWMELLNHRLLIEQFLMGDGVRVTSAGSVVPPGAWGAKDVWFDGDGPTVSSTLENSLSDWSAVATDVESVSVMPVAHEPRHLSIGVEEVEESEFGQESSKGGNTDKLSSVPAALRHATGFRSRLRDHMGPATIWLRTMFDEKGRLRWWAFRRPVDQSEPRLIAAGVSGRGAVQRLRLESEILEAKLEAAFHAVWDDVQRAAIWEQLDPGGILRHVLPENLDGASPESLEDWLSKALKAAGRVRQLGLQAEGCSRVPIPGIAHFARVLCNAISQAHLRGLDRTVNGWQEIVRIVEGNWLKTAGPDGQRWRQALDAVLNSACATHREAIAQELCLDELCPHLTSDTDLLLTVDGILSAAPLEFLPVAGIPLCQRVRSVAMVLSTSLAVTEAQTREQPTGDKPSREIFAAVWESASLRLENCADGLGLLHAGLHQLSAGAAGRAGQWKCSSAADTPRADRATIQSTLAARSFPLVIIGGHGQVGSGASGDHLRRSRIRVAPRVRRTQETGGQRNRSDVWQGEGDFRGNELLLLCSCLVGRLYHDDQDGIRGLFTETLVNGGRVFVGARWQIHGVYSAMFCLRVTERLMESLNEQQAEGWDGPFRAARIVNEVRNEFLQKLPGAFHAISAFTCFGLSSL